MKAAAAGLLLAAVCAAAPRVVYIKEFRGSIPPWTSITVERNGDAVYKEAENDQFPLKFKLSAPEADEIFLLADKLDRFSRPLESNLKVANMGMKTFRFEDGGQKSEARFNYSLDENAKSLADWFERITESEQHMIRLERAVKYDKLGVNQALLLLQVSYDRKRLIAADQFLPLLDRVIKNDSYLHMARERAAALADAIRSQYPAKTE